MHEFITPFGVSAQTAYRRDLKDLSRTRDDAALLGAGRALSDRKKRRQRISGIFPSHTLVELGDVVFYRNIDVPLKELKTIGNQNAEQLKALIEQSRNRIVSEMESLRKKTEVIDRRLAIIDEIIRSQREITFAEGAPPFQKAVLFQYDNAEFIARYLQNPNDFVIVGKPEDGLKVLNCLSVPADDCSGSPVWQADGKRYIMSHFKVKLYDVNTTDFFRVTDALKERGYCPKSYIAQFLINMSDGSARYDYYRIWYEV